VILAACAILAAQVAGFHSLRHDDAFITYRYGQNLASGNGLVFNPGARVMASTSPAHALLSGAGYALVGKRRLPSLMSALGCLGWLAQAGAVFVLLSGALGRRGAGFVALAIAFGAAWSHRFVALETNLVMACVLWSVTAATASRWFAAAALVALAGLLRPDAYLVALPLGIACLRQLGLAAWRPAGLGVALSAPWYGFSAGYFGSVLPTSLSSKYATVGLVEQAQRIFDYLGTNLFTATVSLEFEESLAIATHPPGVVSVATWIVAAAGAFGLLRRQRSLWMLVVCLPLYVAAYLVFRMEIGFEWHLYPALLLQAVLALSALAIAADFVAQALPKGRARVVAPLLLGLFAVALCLRTAHHARVHERGFWFGARDAVYRDVADYLIVRTRPDEVVAASEVGTLAYHSQLPILDLLGLVTPDPQREAQRLGSKLRWFIDLPGYSGKRMPGAVFEAESELLDPGELFPPGRRRFTAAVVPWASLR
jgi:hypothetical protein